MAEMSFVMKAISTLVSSMKRAVKENPTVGMLLASYLFFAYSVFTHVVRSMQIYWNKRKRWHNKRVNSHMTGLGHQHGRRFIFLGQQYGRRDVMWKHSLRTSTVFFFSVFDK